jgi:hypothetical protein
LTFSPDGSKLAWLEMAQDGYESDRRVAVVHDTKKAVRWTDAWDRSPSLITVSLAIIPALTTVLPRLQLALHACRARR